MEFLHFLNLQYVYCVIYSMFGGTCAYLEELRSQNEVSEMPPGFFEQLTEAFAAGSSVLWTAVSGIVAAFWGVYSALAWSVSGFLFFAILSALAGLVFIRLRELNMYSTLPPAEEVATDFKRYWDELLDEATSSDPKLWKHAVLEADRLLGELLLTEGFEGPTTVERLQKVPEGAFVTVPNAWEAHRVRNFVSSGASDFILTGREAFRVMKLYEQVFEEFNYI